MFEEFISENTMGAKSCTQGKENSSIIESCVEMIHNNFYNEQEVESYSTSMDDEKITRTRWFVEDILVAITRYADMNREEVLIEIVNGQNSYGCLPDDVVNLAVAHLNWLDPTDINMSVCVEAKEDSRESCRQRIFFRTNGNMDLIDAFRKLFAKLQSGDKRQIGYYDWFATVALDEANLIINHTYMK